MDILNFNNISKDVFNQVKQSLVNSEKSSRRADRISNTQKNMSEITQSNESVLAIVYGALFGTAAITIAAMTIGSYRDKKVKEYIDKQYPAICKYIQQYKKDDPFFFDESRPLYRITDVISCMSKFNKLFSKVLTLSQPKEGETSEAYFNRIKPAFNGIDVSFLKYKDPYHQTLAEAGYLNASLVAKAFVIDNEAWNTYSKAAHIIDQITDKLNDVGYTEYVESTGCAALKAVFLYDWHDNPPSMTAAKVFIQIKDIIKHVKSEYDKSQKSTASKEVIEILPDIFLLD